MPVFDPATVLSARVVFLGGDDSFARAEALRLILANSGADDTELERLQGDSSKPVEWFGKVSTVPFFSDRRVLVVRSVGRCEPGDTWAEPIGKSHPAVKAMTAVPETGLLLLVHDDEAGSEDRQVRIKRTADQWAKLVTAAGGKAVMLNVDPSKTHELVVNEAKKLGKKITPKAASLLCEMVGNKPNLAVEELHKAALYVGDGESISEADVRTVVMPDSEYNVFELVRAVVGGQTGKAVAQLRLLFGQTNDVAGQLYPRVIPMFMSTFRSIWQARFCLDEGTPPLQPNSHVAAWLPEKKLSSESPYRQRDAVNAARRLSLESVRQCIELIVRTESETKGQLPNLSIQDSMERMVLDMCAVTSGRH